MKILLDKNRSTLSNNLEQTLHVDLETTEKLLPNESLVDNFSLFEQYNRERDECSNYRVILNVNPVCSNVLFNIKSEIVINEGTDSCVCTNFGEDGSCGYVMKDTYAVNAINSLSAITTDDAIRNTEYSHKDNGKFVYHCGVDIFNNHMLRKKIFMHINKPDYNDKEAQEKLLVYNTLKDYLRDANGHVIKEVLGIKHNSSNNETERHIYNTDSLDTLKVAFYDRCEEKDGWWGFVNPGMINIDTSSSTTISVNNMLSNNKPCEFIDFYPDRTLFSFIPKYNRFRKRVESNWDYCITYPYAKDYDLVNTICGGKESAIKAMFKVVTNSSGIRLLQCTSLFKHNLNPGDQVNVYYYSLPAGIKPESEFGANLIHPHHSDAEMEEATEQTERGENSEPTFEEYEPYLTFQKANGTIRVHSVGDLNGGNKDRIFSIKFDSIKKIYELLAAFGFYYKKVTDGGECVYYFRKFKKFTRKNGENLRSDANKAGLAQNIYGDNISQVIFTDDLDVYGMKDENGRPLSNVYFTVIKTNRGNEKWYKDHEVGSDEVEYSHCFGKITTGLDFSGIDVNEEPFDYNVRYFHNLDPEECFTGDGGVFDQEMINTFSAWGQTVCSGMPKVIESGVTIDDDEFYGDIVEFDIENYKTTTIGEIQHRFNTVQRELFDPIFRDMIQDVITSDDYEAANDEFKTKAFEVKSYYLNDIYTSMHDISQVTEEHPLMYANIAPEGYFYAPHNKIMLREESNVLHSEALYVNYDWFSLNGRPVIFIYKRTPDGDVLIGKRYLDVDYGNDGGNDGEGGGRGQKAIEPPTPGEQSFYFVQGYDGLILKIRVPDNYNFINGDFICVYDKLTTECVWGCISSFKNSILTINFDDDAFGDISILAHKSYFNPSSIDRRYFIFWTENNVPTFARLCLDTNEFAWRNLINQSDLEKNSELFDIPFSNGRLYIENNINFFLKRQDPRGEYGLGKPLYNTVANPIYKFVIDGENRIDLSKTRIVITDILNSCY